MSKEEEEKKISKEEKEEEEMDEGEQKINKKRKKPAKSPLDLNQSSSISKIYDHVRNHDKKISIESDTRELLSKLVVKIQQEVANQGYQLFGNDKKTLTPKHVDSVLKLIIPDYFGKEFPFKKAIEFSDNAVITYLQYGNNTNKLEFYKKYLETKK